MIVRANPVTRSVALTVTTHVISIDNTCKDKK